MGNFAEADQLFTHALQINPSSAPTYQAYASFAARRGSLQLARELFEKGARVDPSHAPIWHAWAVMEQKHARYHVARELFQKGVNAAPDNTPMLRAWANMELRLGHIDKSSDWIVPRGKFVHLEKKHRTSRKEKQKQISTVGENLKMLRLMIGKRSDGDMNTVMKWLDTRANSDRQLYDALQKRRGNDMRKVSEWVARRSASDVASFKEWLADRYERDRRIGVYVFNWDIPAPKPAPVPVPVPIAERVVEHQVPKPVEWFKLSEDSVLAMKAFDDQLYYTDNVRDYAEGMYFMGQVAQGLADRAALLLVLGAMSLALIGTSAHLFEKGYSPSGASTQSDENVNMPPPSGVDAHLYDVDGAEEITRHAIQKMQHQ
ncbi:TPR repeat containing protein [Gracilaria domingensis]|nr:TPR repeat containing protein [Gracilaria domingensis]